MFLTLLQDLGQVSALAGAIPATVVELMLAFANAHPGTFRHFLNDLGLRLAQVGMSASQRSSPTADTIGIHH